MLQAQQRDGAVGRDRWCGAAVDALARFRSRNVEIFTHRTISPQRSRISAGDQRSLVRGATPSVMLILNAES